MLGSTTDMCSDSGSWVTDTVFNDEGAKLSQSKESSAAACCASCAANPECFVWNFHSGAHTCKLRPHTTSITRTAKDGWTSSVRTAGPSPHPHPGPSPHPSPHPAPHPPTKQRIEVSGQHTLVYSPERDGCDDPANHINGAFR